MEPESSEMQQSPNSMPNGSKKEQAVDGSGERTTKATRHPRWSRQETIVLIQGKKAVENRIRVCRNSTLAFGSSEQEPVQCRKRWSNLLVDFRKIIAWESQIKEEVESFWIMRNDLRKEMKLPGFFDKDVYDALDRDFYAMPAIPLALVKDMTNERDGEGHEIVTVAEEVEEEEEDEEEEEAVFDSGRQAAAEGGLFSEQQELQQSQEKETTAKQSPIKAIAAPSNISGLVNLNYSCSDKQRSRIKPLARRTLTKDPLSQGRFKLRKLALHANEDTNMEDQLIKVLQKNSSMLTAQLEAQNINSQLDRDQRKEQSVSLAAAINNLTDALVKIANKL
ncbi:hypothetical protein Dsin_030533 [Dipteronia sinensis]|uniref:Myb-like domain-containing protein n=1 Tax=Dipteronia sinensis TaxID=43782 RepID=A0AAD9ZJU9_9ROSI|nr:hypothetical protein Dsin_030533 [Dipteronia sinensis]